MGTAPATNWLASQTASASEAPILTTRLVFPLTSKLITVLTVRQFGLHLPVSECAQGYAMTGTKILKTTWHY